MVDGDNGLSIQRKRPREKIEENEQEDMEFLLLLMKFFLILVAICHRRKHRYGELRLCDQDVRDYQRKMWIRLLDDEKVCLHQLRVTRQAFKKLCDVLVEKGGLVATRYVTIKEIVALFLHILAHDLKNSTIRSIFARSSETISRQFHIVLRAMMKIGKFYIKQNNVSLHEVDDKWQWFKGALGALDGTLIEITVPTRSASDSRVLRDALTRCNNLKVPQNMYYLVDLGYTNGQGFLAPYKGTRYHLNLWRGNTPTNYKELFNLRHSAARNTIERSFGLLKKRWAIVRHACFYDVKTQIRIINAYWKPQAYQATVDYLTKSLSVNVTKEQVKNKVRQWRKHFSIISEIRSHQSGVPWDEEKKMIVITTDNMSAWKDYVRENGKANVYANRPIERWDDIVMLCGTDGATGEGAETFEDADEAMVGEDENDVEYSIPPAAPPTQPSTSSTIESHQKKRRKDPLVAIVGDIASSLKEYMNLKKKPSGQEIYEVVSTILGLSQQEIFKAVQLLLNGDPKQFYLLKSLPDDKKYDCLAFLLSSVGFSGTSST
ncbi:hypothetical protein SLEP1_g26318 [Rubroshorea leprosula]|uniref:Transposase n=1 Tax=Rubroshorea leprosula TaxID=152421 RepID=A0AAV5JLQ5_9ROSI|nr:hypothetical protein SLEP1_g26318 [Rubroshorea leprosula]